MPDQPVPMTAERLAEASRGLSNCLNAIDFACNKERMIAEWAGKWGTTLLAEAGRQSSVLTHIHEAIGEDPGSDDESLPDVVRQIVTEHQERITEQDAEIAALKAEDACDGTCEMLDRKANALQSERDALKKRIEGHDKPCFDCGGRTNDLSGDPGQWSIPLCHSDHPGVVQWHHAGCVSNRLAERDALKARLDALPGKIYEVLLRYGVPYIYPKIRSLVVGSEGKP